MKARVLLVDDDMELVELLRDYLSREGFVVSCAHDGREGASEALSGRHDIAVLDMMMPGIGGLQALREIRAASTLPVLMLTARGDDADRIAGLELGADDYVPKPCTPRELAARLRAILKRAGTATAASALGRPFSRFDRSIDVHISSIRHKLGPSATLADGRSIIQTVIRKGYQLVAG